jgi:regulatory protein
MLSSVDNLEERARNIVLKLLERGPKSSAELATALEKHEIPAEIIKHVISRFSEVELINDQAYAQQVVDASRRTKGLARSMVKRKLADKGLDQEIINQVAADISDEDELAVATELAIKRFGQLGKLDPDVRNRRLVGFLQRRGFGSGVVFAAIREAETNAVKSEL